jgi:hypothetical protein
MRGKLPQELWEGLEILDRLTRRRWKLGKAEEKKKEESHFSVPLIRVDGN